ncbi:MAG: 3(or 17)beta-hydroxysteroid dehydrogenase [Granulosicoccus sp.]|jgi:3(or 17)beta-hydroxysteroid dehydrogenase
MNKLTSKTALITGAAKGIGAQTARLMARNGATVFLADILTDEVEQVAYEINDSGGQATALTLDVSSESSWQAVIQEITVGENQLDILVNNAGYFLGRSFEDATMDEWQKLVSVNMTSVFLGTKLCAPTLRKAGKHSKHGSAIVNLSSIAGLVAAPNDPLYGMTKGGVTMFTKSAAISFANQGDRIRVNSVHPGVVDTEMGQQALDAQAKRMGLADSEQLKTLAAMKHPLGRIANTADIAKAILFLASDDSAFMTGVSMPVDGGYTAQ